MAAREQAAIMGTLYSYRGKMIDSVYWIVKLKKAHFKTARD
jgi:hypothetical protein